MVCSDLHSLFLLSLHAALHRCRLTRRSSLPKSSLFSCEKVNRPVVARLLSRPAVWVLGSRERFGESMDAFRAVVHQSRAAPRRALLGSFDHRVLGVHHRAGRLRLRPGRRGRGRARRGDPRPARLHRGAVRRRARRPLPARAFLLVILSFVRAGFMAATAVVLFAGGSTWLVYTLSGGVALMASTVRPMQSALLPQLAKTTRGADGGEPRPDHRRELRDLPRPRARRDPAARRRTRRPSSRRPRLHSSARRRCSSG